MSREENHTPQPYLSRYPVSPLAGIVVFMKPAQLRPTHYEICVEGQLPPQWRDWFDGMEIAAENGQTRLSGPVTDQAALYGLLKKVRDVGLALVSVNRINQSKEKNS